MIKLIFHDEAVEELKQSIEWYKKKSIALSNNFKEEVNLAFENIIENPLSCRLRQDELRFYVLSNFPYHIIYSIFEKKIFIYSIFHSSRNPKNWQNRKF